MSKLTNASKIIKPLCASIMSVTLSLRLKPCGVKTRQCRTGSIRTKWCIRNHQPGAAAAACWGTPEIHTIKDSSHPDIFLTFSLPLSELKVSEPGQPGSLHSGHHGNSCCPCTRLQGAYENIDGAHILARKLWGYELIVPSWTWCRHNHYLDKVTFFYSLSWQVLRPLAVTPLRWGPNALKQQKCKVLYGLWGNMAADC